MYNLFVSARHHFRRADASNPRSVAVQILVAIERTRGFSNRILDRELGRNARLSHRDRGLCTALVYGVLRNQARLDHVIDHFAHKPKGLRGPVRWALRIGAFELLELGHPIHAVASEVDKLVKAAGKGALGRTCHALIRAIERDAAGFEASTKKPLDVLERRYSVPRWLAGRWLRELGPSEAIERAIAISGPCPVDIRVDCSRVDAATVAQALRTAGFELEQLPGQPQAIRIRRGGAVAQHPMHVQGLCSVQAIGSQQAVLALAPQPGERVLDACAGIGVKTLHLAEVMQRRGTLVATEPSPRISQLQATAIRGQLHGRELDLRLVQAAMDTPEPVPEVDDNGAFDAVLVDAPCTGLGNLGRHPELRWTSRYEDIASCAELQARILRRCWQRVKPGGRLVYAVCSLEPEEGRQLIAEFIASTSDAELASEQTWTPESHQTDGFYLAALGRSGGKISASAHS